ncbi:MAG: glycosyltransferase [Calditrichae bacterium]|nr:glycosyltransferase [Calditrichia bacterium]
MIKSNICLIISGDLWGGAEAQAFSLLQAFAAKNEFKIYVILFNHGILEERISGLGLNKYVIDEKENSPVKSVLLMYSYFKHEKIDTIHVHGFKENFLAGIAARLAGIKNIIRTHHGIGMVGVHRINNYIEKINEKFLTRHLIAVSENLKQYLIENGFKTNKISVIHNGIAPANENFESAHRIKKDFNIPDGFFVICAIGRLVRVKGYNYLLEAFREILNSVPECCLIFVGEGPLQKELEAQSKSLNISEKVIFTGFQKNVDDYLNTLDILVLPSLHEGIPMVLLEAMRLGKMVVASRVGGIPELINDTENGFLVQPKKPEEIAKTCLGLVDDQEKKQKIYNNAKHTILNKFSLSMTIEKTASLYRSNA